jgi:opacity protein-like surface antigen
LAVATAVTLGAAAWAPLSAQNSTTRGLNLGVHVHAASLSVEGADAQEGGGLGIRIGYGLNRIITLYLELDGASVEVENAENLRGTWALGHVDFGARFHFANSLRRWVPYLEAAIGARAVSVSDPFVGNEEIDDVTFSGGAFSVGGGLDVYFTQTLALDLGLKFSTGEFNQIDVGAVSIRNLDIDANSTRFKVGIVWWP